MQPGDLVRITYRMGGCRSPAGLDGMVGVVTKLRGPADDPVRVEVLVDGRIQQLFQYQLEPLNEAR